MPIYEFYCSTCHTIYNFFSRSINTEKIPSCPKCKKKKLEKQVSLFSAIGSAEEPDGMNDLPFDESKMEQAMAALAGEAESMNEDDPRAAAQLMRKMSEMTGMKLNDSMEEALARMEAGEDPDQIEQDMGDLLDGDENPFVMAAGKLPKRHPPKHDETLYDL